MALQYAVLGRGVVSQGVVALESRCLDRVRTLKTQRASEGENEACWPIR